MDLETRDLNPLDLLMAVRRLPPSVRNLVKSRAAGELIIAGGYIRSCVCGDPVADIDVFAPNADVARSCAHKLAADKCRVVETDNAITVCMKPFPVQFVHRWTFDDPVKAIASFDFTIARAAIWWGPSNRWMSVCDVDYYPDLAGRRLIYRSPQRIEECGGSLLRVLKFYQRGYRIPLDSLAAVIARLNSGVKEIERLDEPAQAKILTGLLREVDPLIDPDNIAHLSSLPDTEA